MLLSTFCRSNRPCDKAERLHHWGLNLDNQPLESRTGLLCRSPWKLLVMTLLENLFTFHILFQRSSLSANCGIQVHLTRLEFSCPCFMKIFLTPWSLPKLQEPSCQRGNCVVVDIIWDRPDLDLWFHCIGFVIILKVSWFHLILVASGIFQAVTTRMKWMNEMHLPQWLEHVKNSVVPSPLILCLSP